MSFFNKNCFDLDTFSREEMEYIFQTAASMKDVIERDVKKVPALKGRTVATLFF